MRHAVGLITCLLATAFPALADTLPASCGAVGAKSYTPPAVAIPPVILNRGTVITVTNSTVAINGDTSSVNALVANPGPDGISLQEAIMATNNSPGTWVIQFASALKGSTIVVDPGGPGPMGLSFLTGGNVTINGDIDGDGQPDITLTSVLGTATIFIVSGGNTLNGLALQNFSNGVTIQSPSPQFGLPLATGTTFSGTTISNLVITNVQNTGIFVCPVCGYTPTAPTGNTWDHVLITGNTITGSASGPPLGIAMYIDNGDTAQHTTIANNNIVLPAQGATGIVISAADGQLLDTLIAGNATPGITLESPSLVNGMQIIGNQISGQAGPGIILAVADANSDNVLPVQVVQNNVATNIGILANTVNGPGMGILVYAASGTAVNNAISNLSILGNTILSTSTMPDSPTTGIDLEAAGSLGATTVATGNTLSNVLVQANTIQSVAFPGNPNNLGDNFDDAIQSAGIDVVAGILAQGNSINGISISNNEVDTPYIGIAITGGDGSGRPNDGAPTFSADNNVVSAAQIYCNQVDQVPTLGVTTYSGIKGINVAAGVNLASGNQVQQLLVIDNLVAGVAGGASIFPYLGSGGSGNTVSSSQSSTPWPQFVPAGLVNSATFQQRALAPGSLVSLFGINLNGAVAQFDGIAAPVLFTSSSQINLQVPWELQGESSTSVTVTANSFTSQPQAIPVGVADPGIFSLGAPQGGQGAIVNLAGSVVNANSPAHAGDYLEIYANGLGPVSNQPATGAEAGISLLSNLTGNATVTIGGVPAPVITFAGLAPTFIGLYQVDVQVPMGITAGNAVPVVVSIGAIASNTVIISVQ